MVESNDEDTSKLITITNLDDENRKKIPMRPYFHT